MTYARSRILTSLMALAGLLSLLAACAPSRQPRMAVVSLPAALITTVAIASGPLKLQASLVRPLGAGRFRAIVYNHGSEADPSSDHRRAIGAFFQSHGYVVLFPYRRGASGSEGVHWEKRVAGVPEAQRSAAIVRAIEEENDDVLAAIEWVKKLTYVDPRRVSVAGCSFGGIHSLLAAERSQSV